MPFERRAIQETFVFDPETMDVAESITLYMCGDPECLYVHLKLQGRDTGGILCTGIDPEDIDQFCEELKAKRDFIRRKKRS